MRRLTTIAGSIDRSQVLHFRFDGRCYTGYAGDTLASALMANGIKTVGRSFKYHRKRGIFSAGPEEPNALVELRAGDRKEPNCKATTIALFDGLEARSQNRFPTLGFDLLGINGLLSPFLGAGFYYKTFMWPASFWEKVYEPAIRRAAGLGRAAALPDPDSYEKANLFCDVLVIGGGPAGIAAASEAADCGKRVVICEADAELGGGLLAEGSSTSSVKERAALGAAYERLRSHPCVTIKLRTTVFGAYDGGAFGAVENVADHLPKPDRGQPRQRLWRIFATRSILATGSIERPMLFQGNDLPGVMLASAIRTYVNRYAVAPGQRLAFYVNNHAGWRAALDCERAGLSVAAVIDTRAVLPAMSKALMGEIAAPVYLGAVVASARGRSRVAGVVVRTKDGRAVRIAADCLGVSGGWNPNIAITTHLGARPRWSELSGQFRAEDVPAGMSICGAAAGAETTEDCRRHGALAGRNFATGITVANDGQRSSTEPPSAFIAATAGKKIFVDLQHDVTARDIGIAYREGFRSVEHLKRYTTLGMATDQGRTSNFLGLALMAELSGNTIAATGTTTARPPVAPVAIGALAGDHVGRHFRPTRKTTTHDWAERQAAPMIEAGLWLRPQWYPLPGESDWMASVGREVDAVRNAVGICDVSTLGKIDIQGPDAATLLDFVYANLFSTLAVGRARYGLMLREDGFVFDDGTTARLGETHYVMSTTTANAEGVMEHLEYCTQVLRPDLDVQFASITEQWAQFSIAGPRARHLVEAFIDSGHDLRDEAMPHMSVRETRLRAGIPARLFRLSFSGELGFELAVPARYGAAAWAMMLDLGQPFGVTPYGTEALGTLRIEKGHVAGPELDGTTTAHDLGFGRMLSSKKDYIGRVMAQRTALTDPSRPTLVGVRPCDDRQRINAGALIVTPTGKPGPGDDQGRVTSTAYSPAQGTWLGLGLLRGGAERRGEKLLAYDPLRDASTFVEICSPVFIDPEGSRVRG